MAALYELTDAYAELSARLEAAEDEDEAARVLRDMDALEGGIAEKAEAYARIVQSKQAEAEAFRSERERLAACQRRAEGMAERLRARLLDSMQRLNVTRIDTGIGTWSAQRGPWTCTVVDADAVPPQWRVPQPPKVDRAGILRAFRETGEIPEGVEISQAACLRFK